MLKVSTDYISFPLNVIPTRITQTPPAAFVRVKLVPVMGPEFVIAVNIQGNLPDNNKI